MSSLLRRVRGNRLMVAMALGAALIVPASGLRLACAGSSCDGKATEPSESVLFCSLPRRIRELVSAGFYDGRSADVLGVASATASPLATRQLAAAWPSIDADVRVPLAFAGQGLRMTGSLPDGVTLDRVAPTVADLIDFKRPYPLLERSEPIPGITMRRPPGLIVEIGLRGIGSRDLDASPGRWPTIAGLLRDGSGTLRASAGSLPLDPPAILTTIGTGSPPSQHGVTAATVRDSEGQLRVVGRPGAPISTIATLAEDIDRLSNDRAEVGFVGGTSADRGLVGGTWYLRHDRDVVAYAATPEDVFRGALRAADGGFGVDDVPDVLGVVLEGPIADIDRALRRLMDELQARVERPVLFVVAGTGSAPESLSLDPVDVEAELPPSASEVVEGEVPGGLLLDDDGMAVEGVSRQAIRDALAALTNESGQRVMADVFLSYSVSFGEYC